MRKVTPASSAPQQTNCIPLQTCHCTKLTGSPDPKSQAVTGMALTNDKHRTECNWHGM